MLVDITLPVHNGARFLESQIESIRAQAHRRWRLWIRDDGSTDGTWDILQRMSAGDRRIHIHPRDGKRLGVALSNDWLLGRLPADVRYVFTSDADDVWLPEKITRSLDAMVTAEGRSPGPVLVHTDLTVVDERLRPIAPSFWRYTGVAPESTDFERLLVANPVTGPTMLINDALLRRVRPIPDEAVFHDWWIALVAFAFGRIVSLPETTVLYRRHGANASGNLAGPLRGFGDAARRALNAWPATTALRAWVRSTGRQAGAFLHRYGPELPPERVAALRSVAAVSGMGPLARRVEVFRHFAFPERGWVRNLGLVLRA